MVVHQELSYAHFWALICLWVAAVLIPPAKCQTVVEGFVGGSAILPCTLDPQGDLSWNKGSSPILVKPANGEVIFSASQWRGDVRLVGESNLEIRSLRRGRDDGSGSNGFICSYIKGQSNQQIQIRLLAAINKVSIQEANNQIVNITAGTPKVLTCLVPGNPTTPLYYSWEVDGVVVNGEESLSFTVTADKNMKTVRCTATNRYSNGTELSSQDVTVTLNVFYLEPPNSPSSVNVTENNRVTLMCSAEGNPLPSFQWTNVNSDEVLSYSAHFIIEDVKRSQTGQYICTAKSAGTVLETTVSLKVQYPPDVTVMYDNITHTLTCTAEGSPDVYNFSPWEHRLDGKLLQTLGRPSTTSPTTYQLPDTLSIEDTGYYICQVSNGIQTPQTGHVFVSPESSAVFGAAQSQQVLGIGSDAEISVPFYTSSKNPNVTIKWMKAGESTLLTSHLEKSGPVTLKIRGQNVSIMGSISVLMLEDVSQSDEGNFTITVTSYVNGVQETRRTVVSTVVSALPDAESSKVGVIAGGAAAGALIIVVILVIIFCCIHKRRKQNQKVPVDDSGTVREHLVNQPNGAFSGDVWRQPDADITNNDLYDSAVFKRELPPQDKRPPKPQRTFSHEIKPDIVPTPSGRSRNPPIEMTSPYSKPGENGAAKKKRGKPGKPILPLDDSYDYALPFPGPQNNNRTNKEPGLNYQEVDFDKTNGKSGVPERQDKVSYSNIKF